MKKIFTYSSKISFLNFFIAFSLVAFISSCTIQKRIHRPGYAVDWKKVEHSDLHTDNQSSNLEEDELIEDVSTATLVSDESILTSDNEPLKRVRQDGTLVSDTPDSTDCDIIILENGTEISVKIKDIGTDQITYTKCGDESNTILSVKIDDVSQVKIHKSSVESNTRVQTKHDAPRKIEPFGLAGFICSVIPFIPILGGILGIIFGAISLKRIRQEPNKFKGKGFAIAGLIIGILQVAYVVAVIVALILFF